jgi:hypothetical protein
MDDPDFDPLGVVRVAVLFCVYYCYTVLHSPFTIHHGTPVLAMQSIL